MLSTNGDFNRFSSKQILRIVKNTSSTAEKEFLSVFCVYLAKKIKDTPWLERRFTNECLHRSRYRLSSLELIRFKRPEVPDTVLLKHIYPKITKLLPIYNKGEFVAEELFFSSAAKNIHNDEKLTTELKKGFSNLYCYLELEDDINTKIDVIRNIATKEKKNILKINLREVEKKRIEMNKSLKFGKAHEDELIRLTTEFNTISDDKILEFRTKNVKHIKFIDQLIFNRNYSVEEKGMLMTIYYNKTYEIIFRQYYTPEQYTKGVFNKEFNNIKIGNEFFYSSKAINRRFNYDLFKDNWYLDETLHDGDDPNDHVVKADDPSFISIEEASNELKNNKKRNIPKEDLDLGNAKRQKAELDIARWIESQAILLEKYAPYMPKELASTCLDMISQLNSGKIKNETELIKNMTRHKFHLYKVIARAVDAGYQEFKDVYSLIKEAIALDIHDQKGDFVVDIKLFPRFIEVIAKFKLASFFNVENSISKLITAFYEEILVFELYVLEKWDEAAAEADWKNGETEWGEDFQPETDIYEQLSKEEMDKLQDDELDKLHDEYKKNQLASGIPIINKKALARQRKNQKNAKASAMAEKKQ